MWPAPLPARAIRCSASISPFPPGTLAGSIVTADLTELGQTLQLVRDAEAVVHIAAIPRPTGLPAGQVFQTNMAACYNVVEAAVLNGARRFVYASSMSVLGYPFFETPVVPSYLPFDSAHPAAPQDAYALSKWLGEEIVASAVRRRPGLSAVSLRMPWIQTAETFPRDVVERRRRAALVARDLWGYHRRAGRRRRLCRGCGTTARGPSSHLHQRCRHLHGGRDRDAGARRLSGRRDCSVALPGHETVFDLTEARDLLGFEPRYGWRDY